MSAAVIAAAGITALAVFFFFFEGDSLAEAHARPRTQVFNAARWAVVIALSWVLIPAAFAEPGSQRGATILGLVALIGAVMLVPLRWFVRLGGRDPSWELRRAKVEIARLANKVRRDRGSVPTIRLQDAVDRVEALRTPETSELCDLMVAEINDLIAAEESWNEAGRRSIRIDEISRHLWTDEMPPPDYDPDEATFRWHLYRAFGRVMEIGLLDLSPGSQDEFRELTASLDEFRRADTHDFIDDVQESADLWLTESSGKPWIVAFDFATLGPRGFDEVKRIWGRDAALWGALLDDEDRRAIEADLARRRASSTQPAHDPTGERAATT
jgi:hypothetical protein